jgi:hypothetical protein
MACYCSDGIDRCRHVDNKLRLESRIAHDSPHFTRTRTSSVFDGLPHRVSGVLVMYAILYFRTAHGSGLQFPNVDTNFKSNMLTFSTLLSPLPLRRKRQM